MHDENSPHFQFDPSSVGWLHRRARNNEQILNSDLVRIIEANPELIPDATLRDFVVRALHKPLPATRGAKRTTTQQLKELYVVALYDHVLPLLQARIARERRGRRKLRGTPGPAELLCEMIGNRVGMEPESVRNLISSQNRPRNSMRV